MSSSEERKVHRKGHGGHMGPPGMMPGEKARDFKGTFRKLLKYLGGYKVGILIVAVFSMGGTAFSIIGPKILGKATTEIFTGLVNKLSGQGGIDFTRIGQILMLLLGLYVLSAVLNLVQGFIMTGIIQKICYRFYNDFINTCCSQVEPFGRIIIRSLFAFAASPLIGKAHAVVIKQFAGQQIG